MLNKLYSCILQLFNNHTRVPPSAWAALDLPKPEEIPNIDLEIINYHRPLLGTFHAKFMVVDRKVAVINSNNIQDRPNLEMMAHLEGPIVVTRFFLRNFSHLMGEKPQSYTALSKRAVCSSTGISVSGRQSVPRQDRNCQGREGSTHPPAQAEQADDGGVRAVHEGPGKLAPLELCQPLWRR
ncbi:hypothetical protein BT69DRAFT_191267 [Atractiella rhizophila]|nr:hypothetical protein BT69DRAFT_191267 [Atractiella rhizophila]